MVAAYLCIGYGSGEAVTMESISVGRFPAREPFCRPAMDRAQSAQCSPEARAWSRVMSVRRSAPNFDAGLSRNFVRDIPTDENCEEIDGPCEYRGCIDPPDADNGGRGTHVAAVIAAAADGFGMSGVALGASIVNIRAGQDSASYLPTVVDALTYPDDAAIDVVNLSFFVDPWLFDCDRHPQRPTRPGT
ncbi:S8 family serine peptidase [Kibdelosporangium aridum]|uniref:S8 family serine peptidase n=1 Tax=Kibdelosporangium aridum TaxID=2030 RepID=UPI00406BD5B7